MPCMSGMFRSSTIRSTGSIASRSMASRPLPACVDLTLRSEPSEVITMRLIVGESSTTKTLFILRSSDMQGHTTPGRFCQFAGVRWQIRGKGNRGRSLYGKVQNLAKSTSSQSRGERSLNEGSAKGAEYDSQGQARSEA